MCISNTSRAGAELGYDVSVLSDGIGDRDIPGASAKQLVDVSGCPSTISLRSVEWRLIADFRKDDSRGAGRCFGDGDS